MKTKFIAFQTDDPEVFNFEFLENILGLVSSPYFFMIFQKKTFLIFYPIN